MVLIISPLIKVKISVLLIDNTGIFTLISGYEDEC